uniref:Peptidylprolyl isomerase (cyclophilin)-like 2 n=1 Tax=Salmo trutta TaxID=8032 RepID=A0A673WZ40_SALTR
SWGRLLLTDYRAVVVTTLPFLFIWPGKYHCPVLYTVFTNNSHIVTNKLTGNVFSHEAVEQLNVKTKSYRDLLSDEPFTRQDIITLQDPTNLDKFNVSDFFHVKNNLKVLDPDEEKAKLDPGYHLNSTNLETRETLAELYKDYKGDALLASTMKEPQAKKTDKLNAAHYSTGRVSASFTSTAMTPATEHTADAISDDTVRYSYVKKKGYVRLHTNKGDINLELYCDKVPKAGENFTKLCKKNYYDGTVFHRSIRNFMIQGGDPTGTGLGGESFWGKPFKDEFRPNLSHTGRGVLSMANSGPNTNKSQFFITFRSCPYLDRKHTVFGRVVGGFEALTAMENIEADPKTDKPKVQTHTPGFPGRRAVGAGQWAQGSGREAVGAGQWAQGSGRRAVGARQWAQGAGQWARGSGRRAVGAGQWAQGSGREAVGAGRRAVGARQWARGSGRRAVGARQWAQGSGRRAVGAGQWAQGSGRRAVGNA